MQQSISPKFKVGDWLKHKATGHFLRIDVVITWPNSKLIRYSTTWVHGDSSFPKDATQNEDNLLEYFELAKAASILYGVKV